MIVNSAMSIVQNEPDSQERDTDEERVANPCGLGGQKAECRAGVHDMDDREELGDEGDAVAKGHRSLDQQLGDLIEDDNGERNSVETQHYTLALIPYLFQDAGTASADIQIKDSPAYACAIVPTAGALEPL